MPVLVVAGFLGSGKTTFLNDLLRNRRGLRVGAVVNDFGAVNVDAMLVAGQADALVALSGGCVCCVAEDGDLGAAVEALARPQLGLDVIVVEASGLAEPSAVVRRVLACRGARVGYGGLVVLVDARAVADGVVETAGVDLRRHLAAAEVVVVNKADLVGEVGARVVEGVVRAANPQAPVVATSFGRVDTTLLFDVVERRDEGPRQLTLDEALWDGAQAEVAQAEVAHPHVGFESVLYRAADPVDPRALMALLARRPTGVYRVKGVVRFAGRGGARKFVLNSVGAYVRFERSRWGVVEERETNLVVIGSGMAAGDVRSAFDGCLARGGVGSTAMAEVLRYTAGVGA